MTKIVCDKRYCGSLLAVSAAALFVVVSLVFLGILSGSTWFLFSSFLRAAFGVCILLAMKKIYGRSAKDILSFKGSKAALIAGIGFIFYFIYFLLLIFSGMDSISGLSPQLLVSQLFLQQLTTGFYEELNFRALVLDGYFHGSKSTRSRLFYAFFSAVIFGLVHTIGGSFSRFILTGAIGFSFAVMYLKSRNIVIPMIFHFVYDIFANLPPYATWNDSIIFSTLERGSIFAILIMFAVSLVILLVKDNKEQ